MEAQRLSTDSAELPLMAGALYVELQKLEAWYATREFERLKLEPCQTVCFHGRRGLNLRADPEFLTPNSANSQASQD